MKGGYDTMELLRALVQDLRNRLVWRRWFEGMVRSMPGELGRVLRRRIIGGKFGRAGRGLVIYGGALVVGPENLQVGDNCRIGRNNLLQASGGIEVGDDVLFGPDVKVWSLNHVTSRVDVPIWEQGFEHKKVVIGNGVWIGANSFIMPGARIGDHVVISAGSVVSGKSIEPYAILAGNPARKIGSRLDRAQLPAETGGGGAEA